MNIYFIGGSITEGAGASIYKKVMWLQLVSI
ncbi:hypothetical protein B0H39_005887 [Clostridium beijerinckii]|nr:hypothetical protein [Clostridium beijerinckii]